MPGIKFPRYLQNNRFSWIEEKMIPDEEFQIENVKMEVEGMNLEEQRDTINQKDWTKSLVNEMQSDKQKMISTVCKQEEVILEEKAFELKEERKENWKTFINKLKHIFQRFTLKKYRMMLDCQ